MANIIQRGFLSGTSTGQPIDITTTASAGDTLHAVPASQSDRVALWAFNYGASVRRQLVTQIGGTAAKDGLTTWVEPAAGLFQILGGVFLLNTGSPVVRAYSPEAANEIAVVGYQARHGGTAAADYYSDVKLSEGTDGKPIAIAGTSSGTATSIHIVTSTAGQIDWVWLWGFNYDSGGAARGIAVELGTSAPGAAKYTLWPGAGPKLLIPGLPFFSGAIKCYATAANDGTAAAANKVAVYGEVRRRAAS